MTTFFPDLNVWLALSVSGHFHNETAWRWANHLPNETRIIFARYTQIGLLRLLTNQSIMGDQTLTLRKAWSVYDRWLQDPRVEFHPEPRGVDAALRKTTEPFAGKPASKWVGDCYILAYAIESKAVLVTFDAALHAHARKQGHSAVIPA